MLSAGFAIIKACCKAKSTILSAGFAIINAGIYQKRTMTIQQSSYQWTLVEGGGLLANFYISGYFTNYCEAQARVRQGSARDGSQGKRPQSFNPCLELTLKLVATHPPEVSISGWIN